MSDKTPHHRLKANSHYCDRAKGACFGTNRPVVSRVQKFKNYFVDEIAGQYLSSMPRLLISKLINLSFPILGAIHKKHYPNNCLVIDVTTVCNLRCFNCHSSVGQAPANDHISVEQIEKFVQEAIDLKYYWDKISLSGGETTLHPQVFEIFDALKRYKDFNPECVIDIITNGAGDKVKSVLSELPEWIEIINSKKQEGQQRHLFGTFNVAPIDCKSYRYLTDFSKGCRIIEYCNGLALSKYGYYPNTPCALGVDRVFGFDVGIKKLSLVTEKALGDQMKILCRYCGFFREPFELVRKPKMSPSWKKAYSDYKKKKPELSLY